MPTVLAPAVTTIGGDASWIVLPVVVGVVVLVAVNALRAGREGSAADAARETGRAAPHAVVSVIGTLLVVAGGGTAAMTVGLLPFVIIIEALGGHLLGLVLVVMVTAIATLLVGALLLGRGLRELVPRRR